MLNRSLRAWLQPRRGEAGSSALTPSLEWQVAVYPQDQFCPLLLLLTSAPLLRPGKNGAPLARISGNVLYSHHCVGSILVLSVHTTLSPSRGTFSPLVPQIWLLSCPLRLGTRPLCPPHHGGHIQRHECPGEADVTSCVWWDETYSPALPKCALLSPLLHPHGLTTTSN